MSVEFEVGGDELKDGMLFKINNILRYFNKSNPKYVANLEVEEYSLASSDRRIVTFRVRVSRRNRTEEDGVEGDVEIVFHYDLTAREGIFTGVYCDVCGLSPEDALDILDLARQLALVFYGGVVL
jgi:hypothetical protein